MKTLYNLIAPHEKRKMEISNFFTQSCREVYPNRNSRDCNVLIHEGYSRRYLKAQEYCSIYIDHELKDWFPNYLIPQLRKVLRKISGWVDQRERISTELTSEVRQVQSSEDSNLSAPSVTPEDMNAFNTTQKWNWF